MINATEQLDLIVAQMNFCSHKNGWYKTIIIKKWFISLSDRFFLCTDCHNLIPCKKLKTK